MSQRVAQPNPAAADQIKAVIAQALKPVVKELQGNVEQKISTLAQRNFDGRPVTRAEQGLGPGDPPRLVTGDLHANVDSYTETTDDGARGVVTSSRNEDESIPYLLEFSMGIKYMQPARDEFVNEAAGKLAAELRRILK